MPLGIQLAITALLGVGLGFLLGWLVGRGRAAAQADNRLETELRQQLGQREADLVQEREKLATRQNELSELKASRASIETSLQKEREAAAEKLGLLHDAQRQLADAFKALSAEALRSNNQS